ncbi:MAG: hypothetical protein H6Q74_1968 [Firmicutes bacterium]|nr:hypothetical protein [Bacillota bacterium]
MDYLRLISIPIILGFLFTLKINPLIGGLGMMAWLLVLAYLLKRSQNSAEQ